MNAMNMSKVVKSFGEHKVLTEINLSVEKGCILGLVGKNGAGKTTMMQLLLGLLKPDSGHIEVDGEAVTYGNSKTNRKIGYLPDVPEFYGYMTSAHYLTLCGEITGMKKQIVKEKIPLLLDRVGLKDDSKKIREFSRGMKQRLGLAQALLNDPDILLCDEPTSALDPVGRKDILEILASLRGETTVIFSSHILSDIEQICDSVAILHNGKIQLQGAINKLKESHSSYKYILQFNNLEEKQLFLNNISTTKFRLEENATSLIFSGNSFEQMSQVFLQKLVELSIAPKVIQQIEPSLEELFMEVTQ
ncbi:MAG: ATP-binding cassette domain-containing protein [Enterococcus sp.]